ncbi:SPW repeat domain-containing protein [Amycolatopsis anabasis]|uniref:SPW repeat domain-containing protein n=1 Tax=Amycolatopsis anabasis TaxID=1840409 RepID=UPI00131B021B|nr:hypothetical protein [Amycolatopsis anabasis]
MHHHVVPVHRHLWIGPSTEGRLTPSLPSSLVFLLAVWLGFAPFVLHYQWPPLSGSGDLNDVLIALVAGSLAMTRLVAPRDLPWLSLVNAALGGWLIAAPFVLDYLPAAHADRAIVNDAAVGTAMLILGTASAAMTYRQRRTEPRLVQHPATVDSADLARR